MCLNALLGPVSDDNLVNARFFSGVLLRAEWVLPASSGHRAQQDRVDSFGQDGREKVKGRNTSLS